MICLCVYWVGVYIACVTHVINAFCEWHMCICASLLCVLFMHLEVRGCIVCTWYTVGEFCGMCAVRNTAYTVHIVHGCVYCVCHAFGVMSTCIACIVM